MAQQSPSRTFVDVDCRYVLLAGEKSVSVPVAIDVEADQLSIVIEAVDNSGPDAVGVVD